ncbi:unnamed protein product [Allacma fusca]|uniref:Uncharacterized protein n=1 Tax=Allacma fusca TaxID=39272 RepID=A0A8J2PTI8_9HEXA|nr:unnamed protein product [Allacma fusca]
MTCFDRPSEDGVLSSLPGCLVWSDPHFVKLVRSKGQTGPLVWFSFSDLTGPRTIVQKTIKELGPGPHTGLIASGMVKLLDQTGPGTFIIAPDQTLGITKSYAV